ncbi:MAG: tetratricopeptide repeat protein [Crocinitomicaceae bacterium]|nr:tetratricopeptide repeat protein [Crocinitomicaceae bacterium]
MRSILFICLLFGFHSFSQKTGDQVKINSWKEMAVDKSLSAEERATAYLSIIHKAKNQPDTVLIDAYKRLTKLARSQEQYSDAITYCDTVLERFPKMEFVEARNIQIDRAKIYTDNGDSEKTMSEYFRILRDFEENGYKLESAKLHSRIAIVFKNSDRLDNAFDHLEDAIRLSREVNNNEQEAASLMTLGNCYKAKKDFDTAEEKYLESIAIAKENNLQRTLAGNYNGMGSLMRQRGRLDESMEYYKKAIVINTEAKNDKWLSYNYNNIGNILKDQDRPNEALTYFKNSLEMKERMSDDRGKVMTYLNLSDCYSLMGDYSNAFQYRKMYIELNDSLMAVDQAKETQKLAAEYQSEKREAQIAQLSIQDELNKQKIESNEERIRYQNFLGWLIGIAAVLFLAVAIILWYSAQNRKRINEQLEEKNTQIRLKNEQLDYQHKEIKSSINYAKRIQSIILPSQLKMDEYFSKYSILFMPKDIVSGDFYLFEPVNNGAYFGVVDCTGHGVPGAMMSLVGSSYFSKAIKEKNLQSPASVLDFINQEFPKALTTNDVTITDGMDLALCFVNSERTMLSFAGAHRNCWVMNTTDKWREREIREELDQRFDDQNVVLLELKGNRQGIGKSQTSTPFDDVEIPVYAGDRIVLFTDGYVDQFGGEANKKFRNSQLRRILIDNMHLSAKEIESVLVDTINHWRQEEEQIDDICVMVVDI